LVIGAWNLKIILKEEIWPSYRKRRDLKTIEKKASPEPGWPSRTSFSLRNFVNFFTEKEAEVGSKFPFGVVTIEELQKIMGMSKNELEGILKGMTKKGLVTTSKKDHEVRYILSMAMVEFFEFNFMRTSKSLPMKRLPELISNYRQTPGWTQEFFSPGTSRGQVFTYGDVLPKVKSEVLSLQEATEYIEEAGRGSLAKCYCRHEAWHLGKNCSAPIDEICMSLGIASDFLVEQGFARRASVNEL
jgi:hypothetical protein